MAYVKFDPLRGVQGADIEIIDRSHGSDHVVMPNAVRINGTEILMPSDAQIQVGDIAEGEVVTVTLTLFVRTLSVRHEVPSPT